MALEASGLRSLSPLMPVHHTHRSAKLFLLWSLVPSSITIRSPGSAPVLLWSARFMAEYWKL